MTVKQAKKRVSKSLKGTTKKKTKQKEKYLVSLKREKQLAGIGWKVARTTGYLKKPKKAIGKKGYPYATLNKESHYETFYTWKEKPSKKRKSVKTKTPKQKEKYKKKVEKRIKKGKGIGWGW